MGLKIKMKGLKEIEKMLKKETDLLVKKWQAGEKEKDNGVQSKVEKQTGK